MTSIWKRRMQKGHTTSYEISKKTNIPENKVREVLNGERELPSHYVDSFLKATEPKSTPLERTFRYNEAVKFFEENNPKELRLNFGYQTQKELADVLEISNSSICRLELGDYTKVGPNTMIKCHDFFMDDLNKNLKPTKKKETAKYKNLKIDNVDLSELKKEVLRKYGTMTNAANDLGVGRSTLYQVFAGHHKPRKTLLYKLVNATQVIEPIDAQPVEQPEINSQDNLAFVEEPIAQVSIQEIDSSNLFNIDSKFNPETLFKYLVKECTNYNVFTLYKLLNTYFTNNVMDTKSINLD